MRVAQLVSAFGAKVIAYNGFSHKKDTDLIKYVPLKELMEQSDIVSLHCPVTDQSRGLINKETISYMKPTAFLVNEARGPVVVTPHVAFATQESMEKRAVIVFDNIDAFLSGNQKNIIL